MGVEQVFTFAAMGTQMHPEHASRTFVAATDEETLDELRLLDVQVLEGGMISGLNGVLLGEVAAANMHGACLLGGLPQIFRKCRFREGRWRC